ncbi:MAG: molybdenum cofactor biosynthesis protein MoaE [Thermaerobacterales bacterium]
MTISISVKLFAGVAEAAGTRFVTLMLPPESTINDALDRLLAEHPALRPWRSRTVVAVNHGYAAEETVLRDGDELALIPPVSGGQQEASQDGLLQVTDRALSADGAAALADDPRAGAVVTFVGVVRRFTGGHTTDHLIYEAYAPMALKEMEKISSEIKRRWPGAGVAMHHRIGRLEIGDASVVIAVATPHRAAAFQACAYAIDALKEQVPVWKKEVYVDGSHWVGRDGAHPL